MSDRARPLVRLRSPLVLVLLVAVVAVAAGIGATKLWADIPERATVSPEVTCWNGATAPVAECPAPSGTFGLRWVFPSFRPDTEPCTEARRRGSDPAGPVEFTCRQILDQRTVTVVYSIRGDLRRGLSSLRRTYGVRPVEDADGERLVYRATAPDDDGQYRVTVAYAEHPYTVTVVAPEAELRDAALGELVRFRRAEQLLVRG